MIRRTRILMSFVLFAVAVQAQVTLDNLDEAIAAAGPGDTIILADGTYTGAVIDFIAEGLPGSPITLRGETPGGVIFTGTAQVTIQGKNLIFRDFYFKDISQGPNVLTLLAAESSRVTNCKFENLDPVNGVIEIRGLSGNPPYDSYLGPSTDNRIDHCSFLNNRRIQVEIFDVDKSTYFGPDIANYRNRIDHCVFKDHIRASQEEAIQIGRGDGFITEFAVDMRSVVEYNLFDNYNGDNEIVSSKSSSNIFRGNVFVDCAGALALRGGDDSIVERNYFYNKDNLINPGELKGIRAYGNNHIIRNNYLEGPLDGFMAIAIYWGNGANLPDARNLTVIGNTLKNSQRPYRFYQPDAATNPPSDCRFINNICEHNGYVNGCFGYGYAGTGHQWISNRGHVGSGKLANSLITSGVVDSGSFEVTVPVVGTFMNWSKPSVYTDGVADSLLAVDIEGQVRGLIPDIGCDEEGTGPEAILGMDDVGVDWGACHPADSDCDGTVDDDELLAIIDAWKRGDRTIQELLDAIRAWKGS